jgi:elongation factor P
MNDKTFDQLAFSSEILGEKAQYLQDGMSLTIESFDGLPVLVSVPARVTFSLIETDVSSGTGTTSAGFKLRIPKHVSTGDRVIIDTADGRYVAKEA